MHYYNTPSHTLSEGRFDHGTCISAGTSTALADFVC
jgi:hypothetical protein